jgi:diketogulonate reductase-like aldo/keto reductase
MTELETVPSIALNDGESIPQLGFGVFQVPPDDTERCVSEALEAGYRSIDTAEAYGNEAGVGKAIAASGLSRNEIFVTTKVFNTHHGREKTETAIARSLERLGLDQLDLYLIHWPVPVNALYAETWQTLVELRDDGKTRSIGVSNFKEQHLSRIISDSGVTPAVNQIELHPYLQQSALREFHQRHKIATEAWSPIAQGDVLDDPTVVAIAERIDKTPAQVVLRWHVEIGNIVIPKSVTPERIQSNFEIFDFELAADDVAEIAAIDRHQRRGPDPDTFVMP